MSRFSRLIIKLIPLFLVVIVFVVFWPSLEGEFLDWDDDRNFLNNVNYRGLGWDQLRWMWTTAASGLYIPVTWMSLGADFLLWGMNPRGYHLTNVFLHALNAALLYFLARRLFKAAV